MYVKIIWRNKNPFSPKVEDLGKYVDTTLNDDFDIQLLENFAKNGTPPGFFLFSITIDGVPSHYDMNGNKYEEPVIV